MLKFFHRLFREPLFHIGLLVILTSLSFAATAVHPMDDNTQYQRFIEALAEGRLDFSIRGFQGSSFLALPLYLITRSEHTNIHFQILCAILIIPAAYFAARSLLERKSEAVIFAYSMALSPFFLYVAFRGFTFPSFTLLLLLTIALHCRGSRATWLPLGISFLIKPFSIALVPFLILWIPNTKRDNYKKLAFKQLGYALLFPLLYLILQLVQLGEITVGVHEEFSHANIFSLARAPLNWAHGIQMLFSIHNFYFPDPGMTMQGNLVHSSPLLMLFGVFSLLYASNFWLDRKLAWGLRLSVLAAFLIPGLLDHMDHFYMETCVILLAITAIPALMRYKLFIPLVLFTFHFQWLYAYLAFHEVFELSWQFFLVPAFADVILAISCILERKEVYRVLREAAFLPESWNLLSSKRPL